MEKSPEKKLPRKLSRREILGLIGLELAGLTGVGQVAYTLWKQNQLENRSATLYGSSADFYKSEAESLVENTIQAPTSSATPFQPAKTPEPTSTPEPKKPVETFRLKETIDLADDKRPMAMVILLNSGKYLVSTVASPFGYSAENEKNEVFQVSKNSIYTYLTGGNAPLTWMHSGTWGGRDLFATQLELFLRKDKGLDMTPEASLEKMKSELIGASVLLFQAKSKASFPKNLGDLFPYAAQFDGNILETKIVAGARVNRKKKEGNQKIDLVAEYDQSTMNIYSWLDGKFPNQGFSQIPSDNFWGIKFCGAPHFGEEPFDKENPILYSRWVLGLTVPQNGISIVKYPPA